MNTNIECCELTENQLEDIVGGDSCTVAAGGTAAAVGFALAAVGIATAGWGAVAAMGMYLSCNAGIDGEVGDYSSLVTGA